MSLDGQSLAATGHTPGGAKRRLKKLLAQGMEYAKATELCKKHVGSFDQGAASKSDAATTPRDQDDNQRGLKRNRSEETSPKYDSKRPPGLEPLTAVPAPVCGSSGGGDADLCDPQRPGPSGISRTLGKNGAVDVKMSDVVQASAGAPAVASGTCGMAQVEAKDSIAKSDVGGAARASFRSPKKNC